MATPRNHRPPAPRGPRDRVAARAGGVDVHNRDRRTPNVEIDRGDEAVPAPPPDPESTDSLLRCIAISQQQQVFRQQLPTTALPLSTTTTRALGPETKTLFTCRSVHARANFRPISARDCIASGRPSWIRRTGCGPLMATGHKFARGLMASLSDSATVTSVLWDSVTGPSRMSGSQRGQASQQSELSVARPMGCLLSLRGSNCPRSVCLFHQCCLH